VDIGISLPSLGPMAGAEAVAAVAGRAEALGFASVWVSDHVAVPLDYSSRYPYSGSGRATFTPQAAWLDPFLALTVAATATSRVRLGTSVLILPLRPPLLVAKAVATLDRVSAGRVVLGVGAGWLREEFEALGVPFADRGVRTTESIRVLRACWDDDPVRLDGAPPFAMQPKPVQGARLPVVCGGHSDAALRRIAAVADGWQPIIGPDGFAERRAVLEGLMAEAGRSMTELELSARPGREHPLTGELLERYAAAGATAVLTTPDYSRGSLAAVFEDLERLAGLQG
jgi:probable F420-dependent oxidoreductase